MIAENRDEMVEFRERMDQLISISNDGAGIENDYMFGQHSGKVAGAPGKFAQKSRQLGEEHSSGGKFVPASRR